MAGTASAVAGVLLFVRSGGGLSADVSAGALLVTSVVVASSAAGDATPIGQQAAMITEDKPKISNGEDSNRTRLLALQAALNNALTLLQQAPQDTKSYFDQTVADINRAKISVNRGLDYLKSHPEAERLSVPRDQDAVDLRNAKAAYSWRWSMKHINVAQQNNYLTAVSVETNTLGIAFQNFMGDPAEGIASIGAIGDNRDLILRDMAIAVISFVNSGNAFIDQVRTEGSSPSVSRLAFLASNNVPVNPGSITGTVLRPDGKPADHAIITISIVDSLNYKFDYTPSTGIPSTITGNDGTFIIKNMPPGIYAVIIGSAVIGSRNWAIVEVTAGREAQIANPLVIRHVSAGGA